LKIVKIKNKMDIEREQPKGSKNDVKQVIIIRKDLNMRKGKFVAQGAHASMKIFFDMLFDQTKPEWGYSDNHGKRQTWHTIYFDMDSPMYKWVNGIFKKIVVGAESLDELVNAYQEAKRQNIPCSIIEDAGLTEFGGVVTITAAAIGPDEPEKIDKITGHLKLL
jgi:peptidyl-tRNA hydrolase, PTH2 family